jgi:hypothetical protein
MKGIFTLLIVGIWLSGAFSVAKAQTSISGVINIDYPENSKYRIFVERGYVFNNCPFTLHFEWGVDHIGRDFQCYKSDVVPPPTETMKITSSDPMDVLFDPGTGAVGETLNLVFRIRTGPGGFATLGTITLTRIDYPTVTGELTGRDLYDYYYGRTTQYPGKIEFSRTGGSPDLMYSIDGFHWGAFPGTTLALTPLDIQNLIPGSKILVSEPFGCNQPVPFIDVPEQSGVANIISRMVFIPPVEDATIIPGPGIHYVPSGKNYVFKIQPTGSNIGLKPEVTTDRRLFIPDEESISYQTNEDGVWTVTIYAVREPLNLDITFTDAAGTKSTATGPAVPEGSRVWGADGTLYITSTTAGNAGIYGAAGALVKTVAYAPGTTATPLSAGFYIASLNHGNYKVIVK